MLLSNSLNIINNNHNILIFDWKNEILLETFVSSNKTTNFFKITSTIFIIYLVAISSARKSTVFLLNLMITNSFLRSAIIPQQEQQQQLKKEKLCLLHAQNVVVVRLPFARTRRLLRSSLFKLCPSISQFHPSVPPCAPLSYQTLYATEEPLDCVYKDNPINTIYRYWTFGCTSTVFHSHFTRGSGDSSRKSSKEPFSEIKGLIHNVPLV